MSSLTKEDIPLDPGVYALYRSGEPMYVGKAKSLQVRVWKNHSGRGRDMGTSAMRRNVAEHLGIAAAIEIKEGLSSGEQDANTQRSYSPVISAAMSRETRSSPSHHNGPASFSETGPVRPSSRWWTREGEDQTVKLGWRLCGLR